VQTCYEGGGKDLRTQNLALTKSATWYLLPTFSWLKNFCSKYVCKSIILITVSNLTAVITGNLTVSAFSALPLLVGWQKGHPACKKTVWWDTGVVICLRRGADFHMAQQMPLPLTTSSSSKYRLVLPFWFYLAGTGSPG